MKQTARRMIVMMNTLNRTNFGGKRMVTCYTCHRGSSDIPKVTPSLAVQYSIPPDDDPNDVEIPNPPVKRVPPPDQIIDKYIQALGGTQRLAGLTSIIAKGTYEGCQTEEEKGPVEVYAKAPNQRSTVVHLHPGGDDMIKTYDGRVAWTTSAGSLPLPMLES